MAGMRAVFAMAMLFTFCVAGSASAQTVLFDNAHGERFQITEKGPLHLSGLVEVLEKAGAKVATLEQPISDATLAGADALVISGAFAPLSAEEIAAVSRFMKAGGKVAVMLHIAPPLAGLLDSLQVTYTNGAIRERENILDDDPQKFKVTRFREHPVTHGLQDITLHGAWGVINSDASSRVIAFTSHSAWVDLQRDGVQTKKNTASFGVVVAGDVGKGGFLVFGDDAIFQNRYLEQYNGPVARNLAGWLKR
jgi:hypothetical protein